MQKRSIKTRLFGKNEIFNILALCEATKLPGLLVGIPGVAKTQVILDYAASKFNYDKDVAREKCFVIELDESTKQSEIKGRPNMSELIKNQNYKIDAPIADAEFILINEVDKGGSAIRNTMLSVMRERALFLGGEIKKCKWQAFLGSCNKINDSEDDKPFFDRFVIKYTVNRVANNQILAIWESNSTESQFELNVPEKKDIDGYEIDMMLLNKYAILVYDVLSDRTLSYLPLLIKAISLIWNCDQNEATIKLCELLTPAFLPVVTKEFTDQEMEKILATINQINGCKDINLITKITKEIDKQIKSVLNSKSTAVARKIKFENVELKKNATLKQNKTWTDFLKNFEVSQSPSSFIETSDSFKVLDVSTKKPINVTSDFESPVHLNNPDEAVDLTVQDDTLPF